MFAGLTIVTPPAGEPVSVADAKKHARIFTNVDDSLIAGYISSARRKVEGILKRALINQQWRYALQNFPGRSYVRYREAVSLAEYYQWAYIMIPLPPLISIDTFTYQDTQGNIYFMTVGYGNQVGNYLVDLDHEPGRAFLPFAGIWPTTILLPSSPIKILFTAGYSPFYAGTCNVDTSGYCTETSSPPQAFDMGIVGSWMTINNVSYDVLSYIDSQHVQLATAPTVQVTGGAYSCNKVPQDIKHAILFLTSHFYENRETVITGRGEVAIEIPGTVDDLLADHRVYEYSNDQGEDVY